MIQLISEDCVGVSQQLRSVLAYAGIHHSFFLLFFLPQTSQNKQTAITGLGNHFILKSVEKEMTSMHLVLLLTRHAASGLRNWILQLKTAQS